MKAKPFQVINCLTQGFAVAGPATEDGEADLEMIRWGMDAETARSYADDLNSQPGLQHKHE